MNISTKYEIIKKTCVTVDDSKIYEKERMKTISLILEFYNRRFELLKFEPQINKIKEYVDSIIKKKKPMLKKKY